jgi:hypothetical protein
MKLKWMRGEVRTLDMTVTDVDGLRTHFYSGEKAE